jgi:hypothetical protein
MNTIEDAYQRFSRKRFGLPTEEQVADLEKRLGIAFPDDYRQFILSYNGGYFSEPDIIPPSDECPVDCLRYMHGIGATHPTSELATKKQLAILNDEYPPYPPRILPIGYTIMGNFIVLMFPEDRGVVFLKTPDDFHFLSESVEGFFGLLHEPSDE